jgi:heat shock protein HslJ
MFDQKYRSKMFQLLGLLIILVIGLAACSPSTGEPITEKTWHWVSVIETEPATGSVVPNQESFTLFLGDDGSLGLQVDCNVAGGSYEVDGNSLSIEVGLSTLAYCGDDSLDQAYLTMLSSVESYALEDGKLLLELADGAGRMLFE